MYPAIYPKNSQKNAKIYSFYKVFGISIFTDNQLNKELTTIDLNLTVDDSSAP